MSREQNLAVRTLRQLPEIEEVRHCWETWPGNRDSEINTFLMFVNSNPDTVSPYILVVHRDGTPAAMLVGRIDRGAVVVRLGYFTLRLRAHIMCFVYGALRGDASPETSELMISEVLRALSRGDADVAYMNFLKEGSDLSRLAMSKPGVLSRDYVRTTQPHFAVSLPTTIDAFHQGLSPKVRKNQRWQAKKLQNSFPGQVRIECYRDLQDIDRMVCDVESVAKKSYQRGIGVGFFDTPETRERLRFKAEHGWLRGYVLYLADEPAAFWLGDVNGSAFGSDYIGFDSQYSSYSPGMYLVMRVIEGFSDGNREGITAVDFGPGNAQYKEVLSNQQWSETCIHIFAPSLKGVALNLVRTCVGSVDKALKNTLVRTNLLQKVKRTWRNHVRQREAAQA